MLISVCAKSVVSCAVFLLLLCCWVGPTIDPTVSEGKLQMMMPTKPKQVLTPVATQLCEKQWAKSNREGKRIIEMIPLVSKLNSTFLKSKLLWYTKYMIIADMKLFRSWNLQTWNPWFTSDLLLQFSHTDNQVLTLAAYFTCTVLGATRNKH